MRPSTLLLLFTLTVCVVSEEEEEPPPPESKYGNATVVVEPTGATARQGTDAKLTCKFKTLDAPIAVQWSDNAGASVNNRVNDYSVDQGTFVPDENGTGNGDYQISILTVKKHMVQSTTFYKCQAVNGIQPEVRVPTTATKVDILVYAIEGKDRTTLRNTEVMLKCDFSYILTAPDTVYWIIDGQEVETSTSKYLIDAEGSGSEAYSENARTLSTTLTVTGPANNEDKEYSCGISLAVDGVPERRELLLSVDVFDVGTTYQEGKSGVAVTLTCTFTNMTHQLDVIWTQGQGGQTLTEEQGYQFSDNYTPQNAEQTSRIEIPGDINEFTADYYCSVFDIDTYRSTKVKLGVFHITPMDQVYQVGIQVTMKCTVTSLRYNISVEWETNGERYNTSHPDPYQVVDGSYHQESQSPTLIVPAEMNTGTTTFTCIVTPSPCSDNDTSCDPGLDSEDGNPRELTPGQATVTLTELENAGSQCNLETFRSLRDEVPATSTYPFIPVPCFEILTSSAHTKYPVYETQTFVAPGNNVEISPLEIYTLAFGDNYVFRCNDNGWDRNPPGCGSALENIPPGSCSTEGLFDPVQYQVVSGFQVPDPHDGITFYTHVANGTVVEYKIRNTDCYEFDYGNMTEEQVLRDYSVFSGGNETAANVSMIVTIQSVCNNGTFTPIIPAKRVCCDYPTFEFEGDDMAEFCVKVELDQNTDKGLDDINQTFYIKPGTNVKFDKICPCYSLDWDNLTCHDGKFVSDTWSIPSGYKSGEVVNVTGRDRVVVDHEISLQSTCCKIPQRDQDVGFPVSNKPFLRYVTNGTEVQFSCTGYCYKIKSALKTGTCGGSGAPLEAPVCEIDSTCCTEGVHVNPYISNLSPNGTTWPIKENGKKHVDTQGLVTATRRCYYSEWDLIKYTNITINQEAVDLTMQGGVIDTANCSVLSNLFSLNISDNETEVALKRFYDLSLLEMVNSTLYPKAEKVLCYDTLRYILLDPWSKYYPLMLNQVQKNELIVTIANVMHYWVKAVSDNLKRSFSYAGIKIKTEAVPFASSKIIYDGWLIDLVANKYVQKSFMWAMQSSLFPATVQSDIISPVVWVDLPLNSSLPEEEQYVIVNFTSSAVLDPTRHYACGVYYLGVWQNDKLNVTEQEEMEWERGDCMDVSIQLDTQSVTCTCTTWKMFLAITQTHNGSSNGLVDLVVGLASTEMMLQANNALNIAAIAPLAICFFLLCITTTKRQPLMQCRLQICFSIVGSNLLALLTYWMEPNNISCVYIMYIFQAFATATLLWFSAEFFCLRNVIRGLEDREKKPSKKYSFKVCPIVYVVALLVPTGFIAYYRLTADDGALQFVQPFDAQTCWFNHDLEFFSFTVPLLASIFIALCFYILTVVTFFLTKKGGGMDVIASGIMFGVVSLSWCTFLARGNVYVEYTARGFHAAQGLFALFSYVALTWDVKMSLFPGCFPKDEEEDKQQLVG